MPGPFISPVQEGAEGNLNSGSKSSFFPRDSSVIPNFRSSNVSFYKQGLWGSEIYRLPSFCLQWGESLRHQADYWSLITTKVWQIHHQDIPYFLKRERQIWKFETLQIVFFLFLYHSCIVTSSLGHVKFLSYKASPVDFSPKLEPC